MKAPKGQNRHHLQNKINGGNDRKENIVHFFAGRHEAWHRTFGNRSLKQIILLLIRLYKIKGYSRVEGKIPSFEE